MDRLDDWYPCTRLYNDSYDTSSSLGKYVEYARQHWIHSVKIGVNSKSLCEVHNFNLPFSNPTLSLCSISGVWMA